jgi:hypothetical protein
MRCRRPTSLTTVIVAAAVSLLAAGCGGSSSTTAATTTTSGTLAYARCMRANGVPNFPDPTGGKGGANKTAIVSALQAVSNSQVQAAQTACIHVNGGSPGTGQSLAQGHAHTAAMLAFARCMRSRGFPDFPDPAHGQLTPQMVTAAGIDLHQPAILRAGLACTSVTHGLLTRADIERAVSER